MHEEERNIIKEPINAVEAIESILSYADKVKASDVHIDLRAHDIGVRVRVDGCMEEVCSMPRHLHEEIISRLKILSGARTDIHAVPQDGRLKTDINSITYNIRISFMPTYHGENAVLRLLSSNTPQNASFAGLGFTPNHVNTIVGALSKTSGLILVTGPTGSGKTTTLQVCLSLKAKEPLSVVTLEDPVEYEIPGVRQIHIRHTHGVTFSTGLRACLRQDPDVIMVGEIRDAETARVAVHTALTGHLVLSTIHTNSALETIPRLLDMGIDNYLLASTLRLIVSQRLVRTICRDCHSAGCDKCRNSGYFGRSVIVETLPIDNGLKELISKKESISAFRKYALKQGFRPITDDGQEKVDWGITSREEVVRVLCE